MPVESAIIGHLGLGLGALIMFVLYQGRFFVVDSVCTTCLWQPVIYHLRTIQYFTYLCVVNNEDQHQEIRPGCIEYTHFIRQSNGLYNVLDMRGKNTCFHVWPLNTV